MYTLDNVRTLSVFVYLKSQITSVTTSRFSYIRI
jgi:hypothetical protein